MRSIGRSNQAFVLLQDQKASGTASGTFTSGAWQTRVLNTVVADTVGTTLAANQFTLPAGTYRVSATAAAYAVLWNALRLQNITDATTTISGGGHYFHNTSAACGIAVLTGRFTIAAAKTFELQHRCSNTTTTDGFGIQSGTTFAVGVEVFATVTLVKE